MKPTEVIKQEIRRAFNPFFALSVCFKSQISQDGLTTRGALMKPRTSRSPEQLAHLILEVLEVQGLFNQAR